MGKSQGVKIELGGRTRHLFVDTSVLIEYEKITGKKLLARSTFANLSFYDLKVLIWLCLRHEDPTLRLDDVGSSVFPVENFKVAMDRLAKAWDIFNKELGA
jgi:hypothetical protein